MEELRMKWCEELEQLLECPVCYDRLVGNIYFCEGGHNICSSCIRQLTICAICHRPYTKTRNYLAEHISEKMDTIKTSLSNPNDPINRAFNFEKICISTQTDFDPVFTALSPPEPSDKLAVTPWGVYPCWGGSDCSFKAPYREILSHVKESHSDVFQDEIFPIDRMLTWSIVFDIGRNVSRIFQVANVGLFALHIKNDETGNLRAYLLMYDSGLIARQYTYQLEVHIGHSETFYIGEVDCCRIPLKVLRRKGLIISQSEFSENFSEEQRTIIVSIIIDKKENADVIINRAKSQQKVPTTRSSRGKSELNAERRTNLLNTNGQKQRNNVPLQAPSWNNNPKPNRAYQPTHMPVSMNANAVSRQTNCNGAIPKRPPSMPPIALRSNILSDYCIRVRPNAIQNIIDPNTGENVSDLVYKRNTDQTLQSNFCNANNLRRGPFTPGHILALRKEKNQQQFDSRSRSTIVRKMEQFSSNYDRFKDIFTFTSSDEE